MASPADVTILDVYENAASAKIVTGDFVDYLHLTRWNGSGRFSTCDRDASGAGQMKHAML